MSRLLVIVVILVALAAAALALRLAWSIIEELVDGIRDRRRPKIATDGFWSTTYVEAQALRAVTDSTRPLATMQERRMAAKVAGLDEMISYSARHADELIDHYRAFDWPPDGEWLVGEKSVEPVRIAFCVFLAGGPNYYRGADYRG